MRARKIAICLILLLAWAPAADAALKKYKLIARTLTTSPDLSPNADVVIVDVTGNPHLFIDDSGPNPVLKKYLNQGRSTATVDIPQLVGGAGFIFLASIQREGPGAQGLFVGKPDTFTGTGSTAAGSTIAWGVVTGWTVSGHFFCNSNPPVVCDFGGFKDDTTVDPSFTSDFYDLGTWSFHSTGFTGIPYVQAYHSTDFGNDQSTSQGFQIIDFSVPALPFVGVALLGGSLVIGGATALRRRRNGR